MMAKPMKTLELHYPMIQFLVMLIGYCNARVFIGLAIMVYEPLHHALQIC